MSVTWPERAADWRETTNSLVVSYKHDTTCLVSRVVYIRMLKELLDETLIIPIVSMSGEAKAVAFVK